MPKSIIISEEPVKTGAPISFVALDKFTGRGLGVDKLGKLNGSADKLGEMKLNATVLI